MTWMKSDNESVLHLLEEKHWVQWDKSEFWESQEAGAKATPCQAQFRCFQLALRAGYENVR